MISGLDRGEIAELARSRGMHPQTLHYRLTTGMPLADALEAPVAERASARLVLAPDARGKALAQLREVRNCLGGCERTLQRRPRDVKALARRERLVRELAFLENILVEQETGDA